MRNIAYFIPAGKHDPTMPLGLGWGPRTVLEDGEVLPYDARDEIKFSNFKEIEERLKRLESRQQNTSADTDMFTGQFEPL